MTDEKLIEEAAKAIVEVQYPEIAWGLLAEGRKEFRREQARAALAVFEKAHAPTGDVAEEPEWEYGFTSKWGTFAVHDQISAEQQAATIGTEIEAGRSSGDLRYHGRVMKRTTAKAGPWEPIS